MFGVTWGYLWVTLLLTSLRRGLVFARQLPRDTTNARQYITEFTSDTETHRDEKKHDKERFTTDVRTTLAAITYTSVVEDDETEFTTDIDDTSTASTYVSVAAATAADPSSSQPPCMTDAGTDSTSPSKTGLVTNSEKAGTDSTSTGLVTNSEKDFASTSETTPWTDVETGYTEDMSGGFTDDEMRGLTTGISYSGVTSPSDITAGVTGNTDVTLTAVTPALITVHSEAMFTAESETEDFTAVSKTLASTNKMADDDNVVFITGIAGGLGTVVLLTAIIAVCICRRRSRGLVSLRLSGPQGDFSRVYIHLHRRQSHEPRNQVYEASDKLRPSAAQGLSGIYTEIADDFHPRRTLSAKGKVKASLELRKDNTSNTRKQQRLEKEMTNFQGKRCPSAMHGESRIYTEIPEVLDHPNTSPSKDPVPMHVSGLRAPLYKRSKRRLQRPDMTPGLPRAGVYKRGPSLKKESGIYTEITVPEGIIVKQDMKAFRGTIQSLSC